MRRVLSYVILTAAIAFAAGCGSSSSGGSDGASNTPNGVQSRSGDQIVAAAVAAAKRQRSFHFVETAGHAGNGVLVVADIGNSSGEQRVTIHNGKSSGHLTLLLAHKTAYFRGDLLGLEDFTGLSPTLSGRYSGKWISVPSSNRSFTTIAGTLAVATAATQLVQLPGTLTRGETSTRMGQPAVAVKAVQTSGAGSLNLTLYVATTGDALPILVQGSTTASGAAPHSVSASFSDWGEALHVTAPSKSVPFAVVQALAG